MSVLKKCLFFLTKGNRGTVLLASAALAVIVGAAVQTYGAQGILPFVSVGGFFTLTFALV